MKVHLVGAGPGAADLLTLRAERLLRNAEVVFHDELVSRDVLEIAAGAELVPVGHRAGQRKRPAGEVVAAMVAAARGGRRVVRLKGGDPYLFGRGAEEAAGLLEAGVAFEMVPGVSSALAAPAAVGIPLTHRLMASSVTIVTGHEREGEGRVRWAQLATSSDTLVVLMGAARLDEIARRIIAAGRPSDAPAAVVMAASTPQQRHVVATLESVAGAARAAGLGSPAVLVVGDVVGLSQMLKEPAEG